MWSMNLPFFEVVLRAIAIYTALFILFRLAGKKQIGEMSPFDLILLLIISESVSNSLGADDNSVTTGIVSASSLVGLSFIMDRLAFRSKKIEGFLEGEPQLIIANGKVRTDLMQKEKITDGELKEALRAHGLDRMEQIQYAVLEANGQISVIPKDRSQNPTQNLNPEDSTLNS
jgi:uncharacterized membrane protein YcaP (DUF421 family)